MENKQNESVGVILARFQPIHDGHLELIRHALLMNDRVLILIGSADKPNARNPIPCSIRKTICLKVLSEAFPDEVMNKMTIRELPDLTDETDNSHDWGFYLYSTVVREMKTGIFSIYYSDGYEIITSWFPGWLLRDQVSLVLFARNTFENGISATKVRQLILNDDDTLRDYVPKEVYEKRDMIKAFLNVWNNG